MTAISQIDANGFVLISDKDVRVDWHEIVNIVAFKRDLLTSDLVCLSFRIAHDGKTYEINEEQSGWAILVEAIGNHFPLPQNWFHTVAFPAFQTNLSVLWTRPIP